MRISIPLVIAVLFLLAPWGARAGPDCTVYRDFSEIPGLSFDGVAVDSRGRLLIADSQGDRILRTRSEHSRVLAVWGGPGQGPGEFRDPRHVAIDRDFENHHSKLSVEYDKRIASGDLDMPGLPQRKQAVSYRVLAWTEVTEPGAAR